ncbi:hypothetical protein GUJ93_ZPchr0008g11564 [Zizania palustris]|uniref:Small nuclear ribonucleoprotein E n=1 Tax=Zizania palustris TaxID=103762 RepID=A0A8J5V482_ZIZPA|nr:hypothetical protein GUJ93_ZPchr0008g11564 [Zizania palustris]
MHLMLKPIWAHDTVLERLRSMCARIARHRPRRPLPLHSAAAARPPARSPSFEFALSFRVFPLVLSLSPGPGASRSFETLRVGGGASAAAAAAAMASTKVQRIMTQPINLIFRFLQSKARIQIWLFEQKDLRVEGRIIGFDEYMNLVLDDAEEINVKKDTRKQLGRILLKGDNITLMMSTGK